MQKLFSSLKTHEKPKEQSRNLPRLFSKALVLLSALTLHCGSPRSSENSGSANNDGGNIKQKPPVSDASMEMEILPEPEPCITQDRKYSFDWTQLTDTNLGFFGYDNPVFSSSPIKMVWIMDLHEQAPDRQFFTEGTYEQLVFKRRLTRIAFKLNPNPAHEYAEAYAYTFFCADRVGAAMDLLARMMSKNGQFNETDIFFFERDEIDITKFEACRPALYGSAIQRVPAQAVIDRLAYDRKKVAAAGVTSEMPTPIFLLFNPENNRCRAVFGAAPMRDFTSVIRYLGIDPDNWPPPSH